MLGALGLACIYSVMVVLIYLTFQPSMEADPATRPFTYGLMAVVTVGLVVGLLPIIAPRLLEHRSLVTIGLVAFGGLAGFLGAVLADVYEVEAPSADTDSTLALVAGFLLPTLGLALYGRVMKTVAAEQARLTSEMRLAQSIQARLLPPANRDEPRYRLHAHAQLATEVGGDFFDVVTAGPERLLVAVGDVSRHDVGAGLMMATTKGAFRASADAGLTPASITQALNRIVFDHGGRRLLVSFQCALIDFARGVAQLANAGHMPVLHYHCATGQVEEVNIPTPALGLMRDPGFETLEVPFAQGDAFLFYTDGLTEVFDAARDEFDVDGVKRIFAGEFGSASPAAVAAALQRAVDGFAGANGVHDDARRAGQVGRLPRLT